MTFPTKYIVSGLAAIIILWPLFAAAADPVPSADETAIRENAKAYVAAFNAHDAAALAAMWSPEAVYTNKAAGEQVVGRAALEKFFVEDFKTDADAKLEVTVDSVQLMSPGVAVERGTTRLIRKKGPPEESSYTAVDVKRDGKWLLDRVTEDAAPQVESHREQLKELEWLIGSWTTKEPEADKDAKTAAPPRRIVTECQWTRNQNFITRSFVASSPGQPNVSGMQIIGWDPATKKIRSWVFDSGGGFGDATWERKGNRWFIRQNGVLPDGRRSSAVNILTKVSDDVLGWQSVNREIDGRVEPNVDEVLAERDGAR
ncbi:MAG: SgcJ/EcaC family oxidoreductase [Planctomycetia bacterium]|nr:SgcJ/EcaC family oxidoreductase [Planctomycetia bacterium]